MKLRSYQREAVDRAREIWDLGVRRALMVLPTGAGKTVIFSATVREVLAEYAPSSDARALILAHRNELLEQARDKYLAADPDETVGIYQGARKETWARVICASIQSCYADKLDAEGKVVRKGRIRDLPIERIKIMVVDEAHHAVASTYMDLIDAVLKASPDCVLLGVTATPYRADGGLGALWNCYLDHAHEPAIRQGTIKLEDAVGAVAIRLGMDDGINMGFLVPFSARSTRIHIDTVNLDDVKVSKSTGDFVETSLAKVMDTDEVREQVVAKWIEHAGPGTPFARPFGRPTVAFTVDVQSAKKLVESFRAAGITSDSVDGASNATDRARVLRDFQAGHIQVLCNCMVLTEGWDAPHTSCVLLIRPTKSKSIVAQAVGRGSRLLGLTIEDSIANGKPDCLVLDFVGASATGLVSLADISTPDIIEGVDREPVEEEIDPLKMEQMVADGMDVGPPVRVMVKGVSEYPVDFFGDGPVAWTVIAGTRVCSATPGLAILIYPSRNCGHTSIAISGEKFRTLVDGASENEAVARATAFAVLHGSQSYLRPGAYFTRKPATPAQVGRLRADIAANIRLDEMYPSRQKPLDLSGLPEDLEKVSVAQAMAWISFLHARTLFGTGRGVAVSDLSSSLDIPSAQKRGEAILSSASKRGRRVA